MFMYFCNELRSVLGCWDTQLRCAVSVEKRVAIALWHLSTNADYWTIGHLFGVAKGTAYVIANEVCCAVVEKLFKKYVKIPSREHLDEVVEGFETKWGFPQCAGAIDGSHIPIIAPTFCPKDYYNRKGFHSIILQGLVDHQYHFLDIAVGWPGSVHDARVLPTRNCIARVRGKHCFHLKWGKSMVCLYHW